MGENSKYRTHVLELIRNNGVSGVETEEKAKGKTSFLMFDYFDVLLYRELDGEDKSYLGYLAITDPFGTEKDHKVSYKTLSLYQLKEAIQENQNPFSSTESKELSAFPFLGIIQISLCKENYIRWTEKTLDIEAFLQECESDILEIVNDREEKYKESVLARQLYRSSTTGDFCLVLRTSSVDVIYEIALTLSSSQDRGEARRKLMTYTNIGIECNALEDGKYCTLSAKFISEHEDISFALRFSADAHFISVLKQYASEENEDNYHEDKAKGLFGRYDYLLNIGIKEFAEIYPYLCEKKLGTAGKGTDENKYPLKQILWKLFIKKLEVENKGTDEDKDEYYLKQILENPHIRNINERVLVNLKNISYINEENKNIDRKNLSDETTREVSDKNKELYYRIVKLHEHKSGFSEGYRVFEDLYRSMIETFKTYSALGMEKDAYINWKIYHEDMRILCDCLERWIEKYYEEKDLEKKQQLRVAVLYQWRVGIQAINQYTRLVQNVNYQTYQSPVYEIQTQIDTEKAMVAYREAMEQYITSYAKSDVSGYGKDIIQPILYPDLIKEKIEVQGLFMYREPSEEPVERKIICTLPSFEYFGRLYDVLPWIIHETSHHIRALDRAQRNEFVVEYIFSYVFLIVIADIMKKLASDEFYRTAGIVEYQLIACMVEVVKKDFKEIEEKNKSNFEGLVENIENYLKKLFPFSTNDMMGDTTDLEKLKTSAVERLLDECRREGVIGEHTIENLGKIQNEEEALDDIQKLITLLLARYYETLKDVLGEGSEEVVGKIRFEEKHLQWTMWQIETEWMNFLETEITAEEDNAQWEDALREYYGKVKKVYRIYELYREKIEEFNAEKEKVHDIRVFLEKVFTCYKDKKAADIKRKARLKLVSDPCVFQMMRKIGLIDCNENKDRELFCKEMTDMFKAVDNKKIEAHKNIKVTTYREACADLMMAVSLNMCSFGYCRQVLQIISDTKVEPEYYEYEENNYERFRIVAAVLLWKEGAEVVDFKGSKSEIFADKGKERSGESKKKYSEETAMDEVRVDGEKLLKDGKEYCLNTLKCIQEKILKNKRIEGKEKEAELAKAFINVIYEQSICDLGAMERDEFNNTFLYIIFHGKTEKTEKEIGDEFSKYKKITECCGEVKYLFWRLDCFIRGLSAILQRGYIEVSKTFLEHMGNIYENIISKNEKGCRWEENSPDSLLTPKLDVGEFYNDPEKVYTKKSEQKLENTIDFIQNYYYYNRFKMMEMEKKSGEKSKES